MSNFLNNNFKNGSIISDNESHSIMKKLEEKSKDNMKDDLKIHNYAAKQQHTYIKTSKKQKLYRNTKIQHTVMDTLLPRNADNMSNNVKKVSNKKQLKPKDSELVKSKVETQTSKENDFKKISKSKLLKDKLQNMLSEPNLGTYSRCKTTLHESMMKKLKAARFRYLNEQIYSQTGKDAQKFFKADPQSFTAYHEGYQQQVEKWPLNPVDRIIKSIKKMPNSYVIADLGCGDAKIARSVTQTVHSFDLVAVNDSVTACDMASLPLQNDSVDVVVFCLSLMGTNLKDYLCESNRILKLGGIMKIAEIRSRFENPEQFMKDIKNFGFKSTWKDLSHNLFCFFDFKKTLDIKNKKKVPAVSLKSCIYKKR